MLEHQRQRHGPQIIKKKDQMSEMIIPSTPFLGLRERLDEQSQPTGDFSGVNGRGDTALAGGSNKLCNLPLIGETSIWSSNPSGSRREQ
jgi:hypothetical protein